MIATFKGNEQIVEILLEKGNPNVDLPDKVLIILKFGFVDLVSFFFFFDLFSFLTFLLIEKLGQTALSAPALHGYERIVELLLEKGANVNSQKWVLFFYFSFFF